MQVNSTSPELPATLWLGYGLDMTTLTPLNIDVVQSSILQAFRLINLHEHTHEVPIGSTIYSVPNNVHVHNAPSAQANFHAYDSGILATTALQNDGSLAASFLAVSLSASASHSVRKCFQATSQHALYSQNSRHYSVSLRDYTNHLNESSLQRRLGRLPMPFSPTLDTIREYKAFFSTFGSHVVTGVTYGARLQICASSSNTNSEITSRFSAYVKAAFKGVLSSGEFDLSVRQTAQFQAFYASMQTAVAVRGGDHELATLLVRDPSDLDVYRSWVGTHDQRADLIGVQTQDIWSIMENACAPDIVDAARHVRDAYTYIISCPATHVTHVEFTISSDWGTFGLLSPNANISADPAPQNYPGTANIESRTVGWNHHNAIIATVRFLIINDGSPIHFFTAHGTGGGSRTSTGRTEVVMNGQSYVNTVIAGDGWNAQQFYNCAVNPRPLDDCGSAS